MTRTWLRLFPWGTVVALNKRLCQERRAAHRPTSDGYERTQASWEENHGRELELFDALEMCREAHRAAPFVNWNGNTFAAIAINCLRDTLGKLTPPEGAVLRSLVAHYVTGVSYIGDAELKAALKQFGLAA